MVIRLSSPIAATNQSAPSASFLSVLLTPTVTLLRKPVVPFSEVCTPLPLDPT